MKYRKLNDNWNAEPNAPEAQILHVGNHLILCFYLNWMIHDDVKEGDVGLIVFSGISRWRFGAANDEGFYGGQFRFGPSDLPWGDFYELSDSDIGTNKLTDWHFQKDLDSNAHHFLFFFRDSTFEVAATSYSFHILRESRAILNNRHSHLDLFDNDIAIAADGGTVFATLNNGNRFSIACYLDRRVRTTTLNEIYLNGYPGSKSSIYLGRNDFLMNEMLDRIRI